MSDVLTVLAAQEPLENGRWSCLVVDGSAAWAVARRKNARPLSRGGHPASTKEV
jgi:hypothetical protein